MFTLKQQPNCVSGTNVIVDTWSSRNAFHWCLFFRRIAENLHEFLPNLESVILTGNNIQDFSDLEPLLPFTKLETLSLLANPVTTDSHYREYMAYKWVFAILISSWAWNLIECFCIDFPNCGSWISVKFDKKTDRQLLSSLEVKMERSYLKKLPEKPKPLLQIRPPPNRIMQKVNWTIRRNAHLSEHGFSEHLWSSF